MDTTGRNAAILQVVADRLRQASTDDPATIEELASSLEKVAAELLLDVTLKAYFTPNALPCPADEPAALVN